MCVLEDIYKQFNHDSPYEIAKRCLEEAQRLFGEGQYRKALNYFIQAGRQYYTSEEAFEGELKSLFALKSYKEAQKSINRALKTFPDNPTAYSFQALLHLTNNKLDSAIQCYDRVIALRPNSEEAYIAKSELLVKKRDYKNASQVAQQALDMRPESEKANFQAAKAFFGLKEYDKALRLFGNVVNLNPKNTPAKKAKQGTLNIVQKTEKNELKLALTLLDNKMYSDSLRHFENILSQGESSAEIFYFLGKVHKGMGDYTGMVDAMQKAFILAPYSTAPYIEIGEMLIELSREEDAMEYFDKVLEIDSMNRIANIRKGGYLRAKGLSEQAEHHYNRLLQENQNDAQVYLLKGITAIDRYPISGNPMFFFDRAMEIDPNYALPMFYRGKFQIMSGQKKRYALESFNKAAFLASMSNDNDLLCKCREAISSLILHELTE